jgi:hypothetical protein
VRRMRRQKSLMRCAARKRFIATWIPAFAGITSFYIAGRKRAPSLPFQHICLERRSNITFQANAYCAAIT